MGITLKNNKSVTKNMTIKGDNGVGIKTITSGTPVITEEKTTTPITVTLTDETTQNFNVEAKNGSGADNALTKPSTAPSATQIVAVDNTNTQKMLTIGDGLNIENDTLKASGGTSETLYIHTPVVFAENNTHKVITDILIIDKISTGITKDNFTTRMQGDLLKHIASGAVYSNTNEFVGNIVACQYYSPADNFIVYVINSTGEYQDIGFSSTSITRVDTHKIGV